MYARLNYSYISCYGLGVWLFFLNSKCPCLSCSHWQLCVFDRWMIICAVALNTGPADPTNLKPKNLHLWPLTGTWPWPETSPTPHSGIFLYLFIYAYIIQVALKWPWLQDAILHTLAHSQYIYTQWFSMSFNKSDFDHYWKLCLSILVFSLVSYRVILFS